MTIQEQAYNYPKVEKMLEQYEAAWNKIWYISDHIEHYWDHPDYLAADAEQARLYEEAHKLGWTLKCRHLRTYYASPLSAKRIANL